MALVRKPFKTVETFTPRAGFNPKNVEWLRDPTNQYFDIQRYVVIAFDEMKI